MRWLYKLENKIGRYYVPNLMLIVVIGMVGVYLIDGLFAARNFSLSDWLSLSYGGLARGQVWRLITFIFVPPASGSPIFFIFALYFYYMMGRMLEQAWGPFRLNIYYLCGMLGAILATVLNGLLFTPFYVGTNTYLNLSLFLAFAAIAPDTRFLFFFLIPIKAKWMAVFYAGMLLYQLVAVFLQNTLGGLLSLIALAFSLINYAIFFGPTLIGGIKEQARIAKNRRNWKNNNPWR